MIVETIYAGRDNTFSLQLVRGDEPVNLLGITGYALYLTDTKVFTDAALFTEKENGVLEIAIGDLLTTADRGSYNAYLVTFDPVNDDGVRWPKFKLRVR
jgi:hypothetical protein